MKKTAPRKLYIVMSDKDMTYEDWEIRQNLRVKVGLLAEDKEARIMNRLVAQRAYAKAERVRRGTRFVDIWGK